MRTAGDKARPRDGGWSINIVLIGAHPDDCEIKAGGTCAKWTEAGFNVHVISMTTGDAGHHELEAQALETRRRAEAAQAAKVIGATSLVLDHHDGQLQPTLDVRQEVIGLIRRFKADVVITHRPNDYHPDHRYTSQAVQDAAYMVTVPHVAQNEPALTKNPVFLYFMDEFEKPLPFDADVAVSVDDTMALKWKMLDAMGSQMYEWLPWHDGILDTVPQGHEERLAWLEQTWGPRFLPAAKKGRKALKRWYGNAAADAVQYAELFEVSEYGHQPNDKDMREIFPFLPPEKATWRHGKKNA